MLSFLLFILIVLRLTWLLKPGFARLMISSTNSLVLFMLQPIFRYGQTVEQIFNHEFEICTKPTFLLIDYNFVDNFFTDMI